MQHASITPMIPIPHIGTRKKINQLNTKTMKVELNPNIRSLSGRLGDFVFRTRYDKDGNPKVFAHHYGKPQRRTPLSEAEKKSRTRFGVINAAVRKRIQQGDTRPRNVIWAEVAAEYDAIGK